MSWYFFASVESIAVSWPATSCLTFLVGACVPETEPEDTETFVLWTGDEGGRLRVTVGEEELFGVDFCLDVDAFLCDKICDAKTKLIRALLSTITPRFNTTPKHVLKLGSAMWVRKAMWISKPGTVRSGHFGNHHYKVGSDPSFFNSYVYLPMPVSSMFK